MSPASAERLSALSQSTPIQLGLLVAVVGGLLGLGAKLISLSYDAGASQTRLVSVEVKAEMLGRELAAESAKREAQLQQRDSRLSELEGQNIRTQSELRHIREGVEDIKRAVGARRASQ
jgi:hypothetical protein